MMKGTSGVTVPLNNMIVLAILGLVATQTFVEAWKINCPITDAKNFYDICSLPIGSSRGIYAQSCGCTTLNLSTTAPIDINRFYKLGCGSLVCSTISTLQTSAGNVGEEAVKEEVERCNNECSYICSKGSDVVVVA